MKYEPPTVPRAPRSGGGQGGAQTPYWLPLAFLGALAADSFRNRGYGSVPRGRRRQPFGLPRGRGRGHGPKKKPRRRKDHYFNFYAKKKRGSRRVRFLRGNFKPYRWSY